MICIILNTLSNKNATFNPLLLFYQRQGLTHSLDGETEFAPESVIFNALFAPSFCGGHPHQEREQLIDPISPFSSFKRTRDGLTATAASVCN